MFTIAFFWLRLYREKLSSRVSATHSPHNHSDKVTQKQVVRRFAGMRLTSSQDSFVCCFLSFLCKWGLVHSCGAAMVTRIIGARRHIADVQLHACVIWLFKVLLEFITESLSQLKQHVLFITAASSASPEAVTIHECELRPSDHSLWRVLKLVSVAPHAVTVIDVKSSSAVHFSSSASILSQVFCNSFDNGPNESVSQLSGPKSCLLDNLAPLKRPLRKTAY